MGGGAVVGVAVIVAAAVHVVVWKSVAVCVTAAVACVGCVVESVACAAWLEPVSCVASHHSDGGAHHGCCS